MGVPIQFDNLETFNILRMYDLQDGVAGHHAKGPRRIVTFLFQGCFAFIGTQLRRTRGACLFLLPQFITSGGAVCHF
jgi:hypothetical protein